MAISPKQRAQAACCKCVAFLFWKVNAFIDSQLSLRL